MSEVRAAIQLVGLRKVFGAGDHQVVAVDHVDLTIRSGEFFSLLGPSGSGKTTVLRMVAGFEMPSAGAILLDGVDVTAKAPYERDVNTVFQDYALFPHMSVQENVEYGLKVKKVAKAQRAAQAAEALESVALAGYGDRKPSQLSGGQRQRVALARCFVQPHPMWLLDEPFSALDPVLREEMLGLVKKLAAERGITVLMVTHHLSDAKAIASHFVFVADGKVEAAGDMSALSEQHASEKLAAFIRAAC